MSWHLSCIFRESTNTKDHKSNTATCDHKSNTATCDHKSNTATCDHKSNTAACDPLCLQTPFRWDSGAKTCRGDNYHELCFVICILLSTSVGQYTEFHPEDEAVCSSELYTTLHSVMNQQATI